MTIPLTNQQQQLLGHLTQLAALDTLVPPMLEEAIGYAPSSMGKLPMMRFVGFYWESSGDEVVKDDGATSATGDWGPYLLYTRHRLIAPHLHSYDFGSSEERPVHYLILDREERKLYAAPVRVAQTFLMAQHVKQWQQEHPEQAQPAEAAPLIVESMEELQQQIGAGTGWQEVRVDQEKVMAAMQQAEALYQAMALWLEQQPNAKGVDDGR